MQRDTESQRSQFTTGNGVKVSSAGLSEINGRAAFMSENFTSISKNSDAQSDTKPNKPLFEESKQSMNQLCKEEIFIQDEAKI